MVGGVEQGRQTEEQICLDGETGREKDRDVDRRNRKSETLCCRKGETADRSAELQGKRTCRQKDRVTGEARQAELWGWKDRKTEGQNCGGGEAGRRKDTAMGLSDRQTEGMFCRGEETSRQKDRAVEEEGG